MEISASCFWLVIQQSIFLLFAECMGRNMIFLLKYFIKMIRLENLVKSGFEEIIHVKSCKELSEPQRIISPFFLHRFFNQTA